MEESGEQSLMGADFWKMQHDLREQQMAEEKERVKKEWDERKTNMAFLDTDPFAGKYKKT